MPNHEPTGRNPQSARGTGPQPAKPDQPPPGPRVDPGDPVEEASDESFPASDPPSFSPSRARPPHDQGSARESQDRDDVERELPPKR